MRTPNNSDRKDHNLDSNILERTIRLPVRYGFEHLVFFALVITSEYPFTYPYAINSHKTSRWMDAMLEEMESL